MGRLPGGVSRRRTLRARAITGQVIWVVDGDTIRVRLGRRIEPVRYIGVNAPEVPYPTRWWVLGGLEAHAVNRRLVAGRTVRIELDVQRRDTYGRLLAYVWIKRRARRVMVNAELVRRGYAQVMTIPPNVRHQRRFLRLQREARKAGRGLWGSR